MENCGRCGKSLTWAFDPKTRELTISGGGDMYDYSIATPAPWRDVFTQIEHVVLSDGLTKIGDDAFEGCTGLTQLTLPAGLTEIGGRAFAYCTGLTQITFPDALTEIGYGAFLDCTGLTQITFPDGLTKIGEAAFHGCRGLTDVVIPASVTKIGKCAFMGCPCERAVLTQMFDASADVKKIKDCKGTLSDGIIWDDSSFRNPCDLLKKCEEKYGRKAIDIVFAASVLLHRYTADVAIRPSENLIEWAEKIPMLNGMYLSEQYLRFSLVAPWGADATRVYSVIRRFLQEVKG